MGYQNLVYTMVNKMQKKCECDTKCEQTDWFCGNCGQSLL